MPILKKNEPIPPRPVVITLYGEPGSCKTSLGNTAEDVIVLDADRGVSRSYNRQDTLVIDSWKDVEKEQQAGTLKSYKTIVIDTAKAVLDDFLMSHVVERDFKLKTNKLRAYGEIGDEFKLFVNYCRNEGKDLIIIAHAKKDEDTKKSIPDVTGQSYQLILRISDQVGYVSFINNDRSIQWTPTDLTVGKNTANLPMIKIPPKESPEFKSFMAGVITSVKESIAQMSEAQREAIQQMELYQEKLAAINSPDALTELLVEVNALADHLKLPLRKLIIEKAAAAGYVANKETKRYELPAGANAPADQDAGNETVEEVDDNAPLTDEEMKELFDSRCKTLADMGMVMEDDRVSLGDIVATYEEIGGMTDTAFSDLMLKVSKVKTKKRTARKATA